ncbi:extracellular solute-binding protein [Paenibacillus sp. KQZ6P-2]|uniref:Extracellular solute-binding protein n=1 Tax=Paenibacillus mangrovi TaxID=2931978 RepID=A0A9X2B6Q0_9BACL|nr:extracellular solute-binding protein [Paenibacillus mangrovi]MCJ8014042.1 extracellular solute-binding protein [Paenibacillus mangrovi]
MRMKRWISFSLVLLLILSITVGCSKASNDKPAPAAESPKEKQAEEKSTKLEPITLKIMIPGDRPPDMDQVIAEAEKRMKDTINVKLDIAFVPWADLGQKTQVTLASGENIDLIFDAPWLHINQMIADGFYEPLDDLLAKYGNTVLEKRPHQMWEANKYDDKIMAVPLGVVYMSGNAYVVRKDIREKLGVPPIKTYKDLIDFAYKVKQNVPGIAPFTAGGTSGLQQASIVAHRSLNDYDTHVRYTHALGSSLMLFYKNNDGKVYNLFEDREPIMTWLKDARQLYKDGIVYKDILTAKDFLQPFMSGKAAIVTKGSFGTGLSFDQQFKNNVPNGDLETVTFFDGSQGANMTNYKQWNFLAVPKVSKNKERAIMFLNWANEKENYDLLSYGIQGKHWEPVGDKEVKLLDTKGYWGFGYVWVWNPIDERTDVDRDKRFDDLEAKMRDADFFTKDILTGFEFDPSTVQNDLSQYNTIEGKYYPALFNGVLDPDKTLKEFEAEAGPSLKRIQQELQRQIDAFLAKK